MSTNETPRYVMPTTPAGRRMTAMFNSTVAALTKLGISVWGSRVLYVRGRSSCEWRTNPVNVLTHDGRRFLVAPRGQTQWVRNLRVAGDAQLLLGRRRERFVASEIADADKEPILRSYLRRWTWEVGVFFGGVDASSSSEELRRIAPDHPIFRIQPPTEPSATDSPQHGSKLDS